MPASTVALSVAEAVILASSEYEHTMSNDYINLAEKLCAHARNAEYPEGVKAVVSMFSALSPRAKRAWQDANISPYYRRHMIARKMLIKEKINEAIQHGTRQIVFLESGFDAQGYLIAEEFPNVKVIEFDQTDTMRIKQDVLAQYSKQSLNALTETSFSINQFYGIHANLKKIDIKKVLEEHTFNSEEKTLIIAEGFTMYFTQNEFEEILSKLQTVLSEESEILLSFNRPNAVRSQVEQQALLQAKEPIKLGLFAEEVIPFCNENNYHVIGKMPQEILHSVYGKEAVDQVLEIISRPNSKGEVHYILKRGEGPQLANNIEDIPNMPIFSLPSPKQNNVNM